LELREDYIQYYPAVEETTELMRILRDYGLYRLASSFSLLRPIWPHPYPISKKSGSKLGLKLARALKREILNPSPDG
jgi:hypothetical protein